jgi:hypothetical protein
MPKLFWEFIRQAENARESLEAIPKAKAATIEMKGLENPKELKAITVDGRIVATVSKHYKLVQHKTAFEPIFKALNKTATDYSFALFTTDTKGFLEVFVDEIPENGQGINLGFRAVNSIDGRTAIRYELLSEKVKRETNNVLYTETVVDVWGYRQVCSNGMKIRVPLESHEELRMRKEVREKVETLLRMATKVIHYGDAQDIEDKVKAVQYVVEAMALLKDPIARMIELAKERGIDGEAEARKLIGKYVGKRMREAIIRQWNENEEDNLWGLYNAVTYVASNVGVRTTTMNGLINGAAELLQYEFSGQPVPVKTK